MIILIFKKWEWKKEVIKNPCFDR